MKKLILMIGAVALLGMYSCKKDEPKTVNCTCVTTGSGASGSATVEGWEGDCSEMNQSASGITVTCTED